MVRLLLAASGQVSDLVTESPQGETTIENTNLKKTELFFQATSLDGSKYDLHSSVKKLTRYISSLLTKVIEYFGPCQNNPYNHKRSMSTPSMGKKKGRNQGNDLDYFIPSRLQAPALLAPPEV